jgi:hypothetical protein
VCEDAATFKQTSGTSYVNGGGARNASDKVLQHNGGGTVAVKNFYVSYERGEGGGRGRSDDANSGQAENVGKVYRSCGNCDTQFARKSTFTNIKVNGAKVAVAVNGNEGGELKDAA